MAEVSNQFLLLLALVFVNTSCLKIQCPLIWVKNSGPGLNPHAIPTSTHLFDNYMVRVAEEGNYLLGNLAINKGFAITPNTSDPASESVASFTKYEVLTNPYECVISWELGPPDEYSFKTDKGFVGRTAFGNSIISGEVIEDEIRIATSSDGLVRIEEELQYLSSYTDKLILEAGNVTLVHDDIVPMYDFIGIDEVHNRSPATVKQTVEHKSRSFESVTVTTWSSWYTASRFNFQFSYSFSFPVPYLPWLQVGVDLGIGIHKGNDDEGFDSKTVHRETEKIITVGREITVKPFTSLQACSVAIKIKDFKAKYTSVDKYFAPGLSGPKVNQLLVSDGITNGYVEGDAVMVKNEGDITADYYVTSQFFMTNYDPDMENQCTALRDFKYGPAYAEYFSPTNLKTYNTRF